MATIDIQRIADMLLGTTDDLNDVLIREYEKTALDLNLLQAVELDGKVTQCPKCSIWEDSMKCDEDQLCQLCQLGIY